MTSGPGSHLPREERASPGLDHGAIPPTGSLGKAPALWAAVSPAKGGCWDGAPAATGRRGPGPAPATGNLVTPHPAPGPPACVSPLTCRLAWARPPPAEAAPLPALPGGGRPGLRPSLAGLPIMSRMLWWLEMMTHERSSSSRWRPFISKRRPYKYLKERTNQLMMLRGEAGPWAEGPCLGLCPRARPARLGQTQRRPRRSAETPAPLADTSPPAAARSCRSALLRTARATLPRPGTHRSKAGGDNGEGTSFHVQVSGTTPITWPSAHTPAC